MKLDSAYFNMVRARYHKTQRPPDTEQARCQMPGCAGSGTHRAPKHNASDEATYMCCEHIGDYNKSFNFFAQMSEAEILDFQKSAVIGHRPTWSLGARGPRNFHAQKVHDYFNAFRKERQQQQQSARGGAPAPRILERQASARETLGLDADASEHQIKSKFKELVKLYHPDLNGGNRKHEHRLTKVIQSYNELKKTS